MTISNRVILTGKVVAPSRRHYRPDGLPVIQFLLEVNDPEDPIGRVTGRAGQNRIHVVAIGKPAEFDLDLLQNGQSIMVIGKLNQRNWQTPEGKNRSRTEVIATDLRTIRAKNQPFDSPV